MQQNKQNIKYTLFINLEFIFFLQIRYSKYLEILISKTCLQTKRVSVIPKTEHINICMNMLYIMSTFNMLQTFTDPHIIITIIHNL